MGDHTARYDHQSWENLSPDEVLEALIRELYNPVSLLGSQIKRLVDDEDPMTEDEYEASFAQMDTAVRQLSRIIVNLKRYTQERKNPS
jgi:acyl carrier protein phosphodiesterase